MKPFCLYLQENLQNNFTGEILLFSCKTGILPVITRKQAFIALKFVITKLCETDLFYKFVLQFPVFFIALAPGVTYSSMTDFSVFESQLSDLEPLRLSLL